MSVELIQAIGLYIVMPVCAAAVLILFLYLTLKG